MENEEQQQQPLADRSTNTHLSTSTSEGDNEKALPLKQNGFLRPAQIHQNQHYVSPSDGIMSPCTKKLSDLKGKRFKKAGKPQSLFAKTIQKKSMGSANVNANAEAGKESSSSPEEKEGSKEMEGV